MDETLLTVLCGIIDDEDKENWRNLGNQDKKPLKLEAIA